MKANWIQIVHDWCRTAWTLKLAQRQASAGEQAFQLEITRKRHVEVKENSILDLITSVDSFAMIGDFCGNKITSRFNPFKEISNIQFASVY